MSDDILSINANLKYVECLLHEFDTGADELTLGNLRTKLKNKFNTIDPLLSQYFGIYRLLPLILIREKYKNQKTLLEGDIKSIKIIRDAVVHHKFKIDKEGYTFKNDKGEVKMTFPEFTKFILRIENEFYTSTWQEKNKR